MDFDVIWISNMQVKMDGTESGHNTVLVLKFYKMKEIFSRS